MANHVPTSTSFTEGHKHSAKPRKRKTFSEAALLNAAERKGESVLLFYEELFEIKELDDGAKDYSLKERNGEKIKLADRINAANAWSKLVFVQSKDGEDNEQNQSVMAGMAFIAKRLIEKGHSIGVLKDLYDAMEEALESQREQDESSEDEGDV